VQREISTGFVHPVGPATTPDQVVWVSSLVENLISRLRSGFLLRRPLGSDNLTLLQFLLNRCHTRAVKTPIESGNVPRSFQRVQASALLPSANVKVAR
jgi:hypothetical protein